MDVLRRVIYASRAASASGLSTLAMAQILGVSEHNNRRDRLSSCVLFHQGHVLQAVEGRPADVERLLTRVRADRRHIELRVLVDTPISRPTLSEPMSICGDPVEMLAKVGRPCLSLLTAQEAEAILERPLAA